MGLRRAAGAAELEWCFVKMSNRSVNLIPRQSREHWLILNKVYEKSLNQKISELRSE
jgi:hypothetical protein